MSEPAIEPRLLSRKQAAAYCGMCPASFDRVCPVRPVALGMKNLRYDRRSLDRWIDGLDYGVPHKRDWLAAFDHGRHGDAP
jgi:predicted DNA-binding transcriptional regulator AlpA